MAVGTARRSREINDVGFTRERFRSDLEEELRLRHDRRCPQLRKGSGCAIMAVLCHLGHDTIASVENLCIEAVVDAWDAV